MPHQKRTRPVGKRPAEPEPEPTERSCCKPYPDATFVNGQLTLLFAHHNGPRCEGNLEPMSLKDWNDDVGARTTAGRRSRGDE